MPQGKRTGRAKKRKGVTKIMKIYNTLTKRKEEFVPLQEGKVSMVSDIRFTTLSTLEMQDL